MQCDRIARAYRWLEYIAFGRALEKHRFYYLEQARHCSRPLLLGDGDGRFLCKLAVTHPTIQIDAIDASAGMLRETRKRMKQQSVPNPSRIHLRHENVFRAQLPQQTYDLVVANFFFDCFSNAALIELMKRVLPACRSKAIFIISEFQQPPGGWRAMHSNLWLTTMYSFFAIATGLETRHLPDYAEVLQCAGLRLQSRRVSRAGLLASELWGLG